MRNPIILGLFLLVFAVLAGCTGTRAPEIVIAQPAVPAQPAISGQALTLGRNLAEEDRQAAFDAQLLALEKGQRQTWRGKHGAFGYVEPGVETARADGVCRDYAHKIYIAGRPQSGNGAACRDAAGTWRFLS